MAAEGPLRILQVDKFGSRLEGGGATGYMLEIIGRQRARGHVVEFLATEGGTDIETELRPLFPRRLQFNPPPDGALRRASDAAHMVWSRSSAAAMSRAIDAFRPDIIHLHNTYHHLTPSILRPAKKAGIPIVMTVHDFKLVCPTYRLMDGTSTQCDACVGGSVSNVVKRRCQNGSRVQSAVLMVESGLHRSLGAYDPVDVFLCPSAFMADLLRRGGFGPRVRHLPYGYDLDSITPRTTAGEGVVFVGRLAWEKGVDHLIEAMALLDDVHLTICGSGPKRAELESLAAARLPGRHTFRGHLDRASVLAEIQRSAVSAVPSVWPENQPLSIIETSASGVPVVSGNTEAMREMVLADVTGLTVDPHDHRALADALDTFVRDPALQRRIATTARAHAESVHDMTRHLDQLEDVYRSLMSASGRAT